MIRHLPWLVWGLSIAIASLLPGDQLPVYHFDWISIDKWVHFILYGVLVYLQLWAFRANFRGNKNKMNPSDIHLYGWLILVGFCFGLTIELIQGNYSYQRYFDPIDLMSNIFGTIFGVFGYWLTGIKFIKN